MNGPNRIDPAGCGCTDCLTGWSRPADTITATLEAGGAADYHGSLTDLHGRVLLLEDGGDGMFVCLAYLLTPDGGWGKAPAFVCRAQSLTPVASREEVRSWCLPISAHEARRAYLAGERTAF